jgi:hypothetical protein
VVDVVALLLPYVTVPVSVAGPGKSGIVLPLKTQYQMVPGPHEKLSSFAESSVTTLIEVMLPWAGAGGAPNSTKEAAESKSENLSTVGRASVVNAFPTTSWSANPAPVALQHGVLANVFSLGTLTTKSYTTILYLSPTAIPETEPTPVIVPSIVTRVFWARDGAAQRAAPTAPIYTRPTMRPNAELNEIAIQFDFFFAVMKCSLFSRDSERFSRTPNANTFHSSPGHVGMKSSPYSL